MYAVGFEDEAKLLLKTEQDKPHQKIPNLWNKIVPATHRSVSKPISWF